MKTRMKIIGFALVASLTLPVAAQAQSRELRGDRQDIREEQRELREARRDGDRRDVREETRDVRAAKREYREDWREYRDRNRAIYRGGTFRAPFRYYRFGEGSRIRPGYFQPGYHVSNHARYRLPAPGRYQRYVRHYNDVLLVNTRTGIVVRVYRGFYW